MTSEAETYYRDDLAFVHHRNFAAHSALCAPAILRLLEPVLANNGLVLELGCGSGLLTSHLVTAGHRVIATDASESMLALARRHVPGAEEIRRIRLPDDPLSNCDAVVSTGHALSCLADESEILRTFAAAAKALTPGGVMTVDIFDLEWGRSRKTAETRFWQGDDWFLATEFTLPSPDRVVRNMTIFMHNANGTWRRDDERHDNVLIKTSRLPSFLARHGVEATVESSFANAQREPLPRGLVAIVGHRR